MIPNSEKPGRLDTRNPFIHIQYGPYVLFPIICACVWLAEILALLALWVQEGKPRYRGDEASVVFISDVGAVHQRLFEVMSCITSFFFIMSLFAERWLRHVDRLPTDLRRREKVFDWIAIVCCIIASAGLILCSFFNAFDHSSVHWSCALAFVVFTALSAIFQSAELWSLHKDHPDRKGLLRNSVYKLIIVTLAIAVAIAFGVTYGVCSGEASATNGRSAQTCNQVTSAAAACEWTIAFILFFYFLTLAMDLWPAGKSSPRYMRRLARWQEKHGEGDDFTGRRAFGEHPERWQDRAQVREEQLKREMLARNLGNQGGLVDGPIPGSGIANQDGYRMSEASEGSYAPLNAQRPGRY